MKEFFLYEDIMLSTKKILTAIASPTKLQLRTIYSGSHPDEMHHWFEMHKHHTSENGYVHGALFEHGHGHLHSHHGARHMHSEPPHHHAHDLKSVSHTDESQKPAFKAW